MKQNGLEAIHWSDVGESTAPDTELMEHSRAGGYVILTHDVDFGRLQATQAFGGPSWGVWSASELEALDYKTGKVQWKHVYPENAGGHAGILTTAGKLLFTGDPSDNAIAFDPATGDILWHAGLASSVSNGPMTYMLDDRQYVVFGAGDMLYAFRLPK